MRGVRAQDQQRFANFGKKRSQTAPEQTRIPPLETSIEHVGRTCTLFCPLRLCLRRRSTSDFLIHDIPKTRFGDIRHNRHRRRHFLEEKVKNGRTRRSYSIRTSHHLSTSTCIKASHILYFRSSSTLTTYQRKQRNDEK